MTLESLGTKIAAAVALASLALALAAGCRHLELAESADGDSDVDVDGDSDGDGDGDGDSDGDGDGDGDGDSDGDGDADGDGDVDATCDACPLNWGYPCACDVEPPDPLSEWGLCDDGSVCGKLDLTDEFGVCLRECYDPDSSSSGCEPEIDCGGLGQCVLTDGSDNFYCAYTCEADAECPSGMECSEDVGVGICLAIEP